MISMSNANRWHALSGYSGIYSDAQIHTACVLLELFLEWQDFFFSRCKWCRCSNFVESAVPCRRALYSRNYSWIHKITNSNGNICGWHRRFVLCASRGRPEESEFHLLCPNGQRASIASNVDAIFPKNIHGTLAKAMAAPTTIHHFFPGAEFMCDILCRCLLHFENHFFVVPSAATSFISRQLATRQSSLDHVWIFGRGKEAADRARVKQPQQRHNQKDEKFKT